MSYTITLLWVLWSKHVRIILGRGLEILWGYKDETWRIAVTNKVKISVIWLTPLSGCDFRNFNICYYSEVIGNIHSFWASIREVVDLRISGNNCIPMSSIWRALKLELWLQIGLTCVLTIVFPLVWNNSCLTLYISGISSNWYLHSIEWD